jgi:hypothetical protein
MLDPDDVMDMKAVTVNVTQAVNALNDYYAAEDMPAHDIKSMCTLVPGDGSSFKIAFRLHDISTSDLGLDFFDDNAAFINEVYKDKPTALLALNDIISQAVKPII